MLHASRLNVVFIMWVAILAMGCGNETPSLSLLPDSNEFFQDVSSSSVNGKIDILWVVDNSGSMETSQQNVAENFQSFIADFETKGFDFKIAVTTTEAYKTVYNEQDEWSQFKDGTDQTSHSGVSIITPLIESIADVFLTNISQGVSGSGNERAFQSFRSALNLSENSEFIREDGFLSVIIVSDEDDFSRDSPAWTENYETFDIHPVQDYVDYLDQQTGSTAEIKSYSVSAVAIFDEACRDELNESWTGRKIGIRYGELVDLTGGTKGSLCGDFANILEDVSQNILSLATQFYLSRIPIEETIVVQVNSVVIPKASLNPGPSVGGWSYVSETNSIQFNGDYIPEAGAKIKVDFDPFIFGS